MSRGREEGATGGQGEEKKKKKVKRQKGQKRRGTGQRMRCKEVVGLRGWRGSGLGCRTRRR